MSTVFSFKSPQHPQYPLLSHPPLSPIRSTSPADSEKLRARETINRHFGHGRRADAGNLDRRRREDQNPGTAPHHARRAGLRQAHARPHRPSSTSTASSSRDIQEVIGSLRPLPGAKEFLDELRSLVQVVILSDTFEQFAAPLLRQLNFPTLLCHRLVVENDRIVGLPASASATRSARPWRRSGA